MTVCYWKAGVWQNKANGDENAGSFPPAKCSAIPFAPAVKVRGEGCPKRTAHVLPGPFYHQSCAPNV